MVNLEKSGERNVFKAKGLPLSTAPTAFNPKESRGGYSIKCDTTGKTDYVKYFYGNRKVNTHYSAPFWANGDGSGTWVNKFDFLAQQCGTFRIVVKSYSWEGGDRAPCSTSTIVLKSSKRCIVKPLPKPKTPPTPSPRKPTPPPRPSKCFFYEHYGFQGRRLSLASGAYSIGFLKAKRFNDVISLSLIHI